MCINESDICTGNLIVDKVAMLNISGNVIPEAWYHTITNKNGAADALAIFILSDIVYWYRPVKEIDNSTDTVSWHKRFKADDFIQYSYQQIAEKFNISEKQAKAHILVLEDLGVIKRHLRTITVSGRKISNVMYIELFPDILEELTFPDKKVDAQQVHIPTSNATDIPPKKDTGSTNKLQTYTKTTADNSTKNSTTADSAVVAQSTKLLDRFGLSDKDISSIVVASGNDLNKIAAAKDLYSKQNGMIRNVPGWFISAVKGNWRSRATYPCLNNGQHFMLERRYESTDYAKLEKALLSHHHSSTPA